MRTRRKEQRPAEIIEAAFAEFAEAGFANTRMEAIADRAGAAKGTLYRYFPNKDELFLAVVDHYLRPVFDPALSQMETVDGPSREILINLLERIYRELLREANRGAILRILITEGDRFPALIERYHGQVICRIRTTINNIIQRGVQRGEFSVSAANLDPMIVVAPIIMAFVWQLVFQKVEPIDLERYSRSHIQLLLSGLGVMDKRTKKQKKTATENSTRS